MQERLYFNESQRCPVQVIKGEESKEAFIFNLSSGGMCFVLPKFEQKKPNDDFSIGEDINLSMAPLRLSPLKCRFKIIHVREDRFFRYYGGSFLDLNKNEKTRIESELLGVKARVKTKRAPYLGALWLAVSATMFYLATRF